MMIGGFSLLCLLLLFFLQQIHGLDNGLALTPPMGWLAWQRYRCITDCETYPDECVSEKLFKQATDLLVSEGYAALGYQYVIVDDCWLSHNRSADGKLQADEKRFPSGIKALSDYVHSKGLKFGLYQDWGKKTCAGYPGVLGNEQLDVMTFAEWEVDYVKLDGCYSDVRDMDEGYKEFSRLLNKTGRPMVYSCSWPAYQEDKGMVINYTALATFCNLWRNAGDIDDSWKSVMDIADYFALKQDFWSQYAGPGHWNDPDMLVIGNFGLSIDQSKVQMSIWAILAAPLLMSNKLSEIRSEFKDVLQNREIIKINQDALGIQGKRVFRDKEIDIWTRPVEPVHNGYYSYAVAFVSRRSDGAPFAYKILLKHLRLDSPNGYTITNLFDKNTSFNNQTIFVSKSFIKVRVNPSGVVFLRVNANLFDFQYDLYNETIVNKTTFI
ncbi:alpha-N-acetylgalactosaminidase-like [Daktulosphaira vitifoliae]|uniref:alpha-N-acetylgalactosaminidase-like n=1 Tax=Daktulosphaira vitifoliae TaxID=58002 RepID=UPI0021AAA82F|nr:alpha-N-acetylgalactosaminidase-like [Daktulosphaira vitifoliae]XP_050536027.1 alpha-N-acetylgalactosaminidase-like [Daktulosphaira vitifoliae]